MRISGLLIGILVIIQALAFHIQAQPVTKIAAGKRCAMFLKSDGSLWAMGDNEHGQLGDGGYVYASPYGTNRPEQIIASNVTVIAVGYTHSLFIKSDGSLWGMGDNQYGELGDGTTNSIDVPEQIIPSGVTGAAAGGQFSLFTKNDGSLWYMGLTSHGLFQNYLGLQVNSENYVTSPQEIAPNGVKSIAAGFLHSMFLKNDGTLWAMGWSADGQLGDGTLDIVNGPEQIVPGDVTEIAAGNSDSLFLMNDGSLWGMGNNGQGQLGAANFPTYTSTPQQIVASGVTAIAADTTDTIFLMGDGSLWGMGESSTGQLGDGTYGQTNSPELIVSGGVTAIVAGYQDTLFIRRDGSLWGMGDNSIGQMGLGNYDGFNGSMFPFEFNQPTQILAAYNQVSSQLLTNGDIQLSFVGIAGASYTLERSFSLSPADWIPQLTNISGSFGAILFTNTPDPTTNNFWRIRWAQ